jgi:hypothetical protein
MKNGKVQRLPNNAFRSNGVLSRRRVGQRDLAQSQSMQSCVSCGFQFDPGHGGGRSTLQDYLARASAVGLVYRTPIQTTQRGGKQINRGKATDLMAATIPFDPGPPLLTGR